MVYNKIMENNKLINNIVIENILSEEQIQRINQKVSKYILELPTFDGDFDKYGDKTILTKLINKFTGRLMIHCFDLDDDIIESFSNSLKENGFNEYIYRDATSYAEYDLKYGNPKLPEHKDAPGPQEHIIVDYQLDCNIDWPMMINNVKYPMPKNSMLIFNGLDQYHSRPRIIFNEGEFVKVLLIRFDRIK